MSGGAVTPVTLRENRREDGTVYPLGTEDAAKLAAARLAGVEKYSMYVIEERNVAPDRLESLRKALEQRHAAGN